MIFSSKSQATYIYHAKTNKIFYLSKNKSINFKEIEKSKNLENIEHIQMFGPKKGWLDDNKKIKSLTLNVTDACNLRCTYCAYSGHYVNERSHGNSVMPFDIAKSAIDFYSVNEVKNHHISIYGGEPLLAKNLIRKIVSYAKNKIGKPISFSINTNAILLSNNWIDFIIENNIKLQVSIDGSEMEHDRYRVNKKGQGTYRDVLNGLQKIFDRNEEFYRKNLTFIATLTPPYNLLSVVENYKNNELFNSQCWFINYVNPINTTFFDLFGNNENYKKYDEQELLVANDFIDSCIKGNSENHFGNWLFGNLLKKIHTRSMNPNNLVWINGSCIPGVDKMFIDTSGGIHPCERSGNFMPLGNVNSGVDSSIASNIVENYIEDANKNCANCSNVRFCDTCYLSARDGNKQDFSKKYEFCNRRIEKTKLIFYIYTSILEKNPNGLDNLMQLLLDHPQYNN